MPLNYIESTGRFNPKKHKNYPHHIPDHIEIDLGYVVALAVAVVAIFVLFGLFVLGMETLCISYGGC